MFIRKTMLCRQCIVYQNLLIQGLPFFDKLGCVSQPNFFIVLKKGLFYGLLVEKNYKKLKIEKQ